MPKPRRSSIEIKKKILNLLLEHQPLTYAELERKLSTNFQTVVDNCKELEYFGFLTIKKKEHHEANARAYYEISLTEQGKIIAKNA